MKKVEKVSIAEISFTLDNDAYQSLKQYLDSLHEYYDKDPDGGEIIADIEARIAELILGEQVYTKVVSRALVDRIIAQLGTPQEIDDEAGEGAKGSSAGSLAGASGASLPRRLHRSPDGRIFGGVCSGMARFLDINVAWIRLIFLFPLMLIVIAAPVHWFGLQEFGEGWSWVFIVTYIVLWIALPIARTPRQRLEARGERVTSASIRQNLQETATTPGSKKAASVVAEVVTVLGRAVLLLVKFVTAIIGFSLLFTALAILIGMVVALFAPESIAIMHVSVTTLLHGLSISPLLFVELALLCISLPLLVLGMALLSFTFNWRLGRLFYGLTLGIWGAAMILLGVVSIGNARFFHDQIPHRIHSGWVWHDEQGEQVKAGDVRRQLRDSFEGADGVSVDAADDSLVIVVRKNGAPNDTLKITESTIETTVGNRTSGRRVEIRQIE